MATPLLRAIVVVGSTAAPVLAQYGPMSAAPPVSQLWVAREGQPGAGEANDEGVDNAFWTDPATGQSYVFATGWVTEANGATRFATFKYPADFVGPGQPPHAAPPAYYPTVAPATHESHQATAMAVDAAGNVYVTGFSQRPGTVWPVHLHRYVTIKYDKDLTAQWTAIYTGPDPNGSDTPSDVQVTQFGSVVVITGVSHGGPVTGHDIATVAYDGNTGLPSAYWPDQGHGPGVRRYDNGATEGAGELVGPNIAGAEGGHLWVALVGGTTAGTSAGFDILTIMYGGVDGSIVWLQQHDPSVLGDQIGAGIAQDSTFSNVFVTGWGATTSGSTNLDYITLVYDYPTGVLRAQDNFDVSGQRDSTVDIQWSVDAGGQRVWVTGCAQNSPGECDFATVRYDWNPAGPTLTRVWTSRYGPVAGQTDEAANMAVFNGDGYIVGLTTAAGINYDWLTVRYAQTPVPPVYPPRWAVMYGGFGGIDRARAVTVGIAQGSMNPSVFVTGASQKAGQGLDMVTIRYKQSTP